DAGAPAELAFCPYPPAVGFYDVLDDGQAEAGAAGGAAAAGLDPVEALKDAGQVARRNARAGVGYGEPGAAPAAGFHRDGDGAAPGGILEAVVQQVGEDLVQPLPVEPSRHMGRGL